MVQLVRRFQQLLGDAFQKLHITDVEPGKCEASCDVTGVNVTTLN